MTIFEQLQAAGVPVENHESDLYTPVNEVTKPIVDAWQFRAQVTTFVSNVDGKHWYDLPFAYDPFWDNKAGKR